METINGTRFICRLSDEEAELFKVICTLTRVSSGDPMYQLSMLREFGLHSQRALRDADIQGNA